MKSKLARILGISFILSIPIIFLNKPPIQKGDIFNSYRYKDKEMKHPFEGILNGKYFYKGYDLNDNGKLDAIAIYGYNPFDLSSLFFGRNARFLFTNRVKNFPINYGLRDKDRNGTLEYELSRKELREYLGSFDKALRSKKARSVQV